MERACDRNSGGEFNILLIVVVDLTKTLTIFFPQTDAIFSDDIMLSDQLGQSITQQSSVVFWTTTIHIICSYLSYVFSKFACKIQIQGFSFSFPISLTVPASITTLIVFGGLRAANTCAFHNYISDDLFFNMPPVYYLSNYVVEEYVWIWVLSLLAQAWTTRHIWSAKTDRNASTERLFVLPMYNSLLIDQCLVLNRCREEEENLVKKAVFLLRIG